MQRSLLLFAKALSILCKNNIFPRYTEVSAPHFVLFSADKRPNARQSWQFLLLLQRIKTF
jgi:hypothetical protein